MSDEPSQKHHGTGKKQTKLGKSCGKPGKS